MIIETAFDIRLEHLEGPLWDEETNSLYWVDLLEGDFYSGNIDNKIIIKKNIGQPLGAVVLRESGGVVLAAHQGFGFDDFEKKSIPHFLNNPQPNYPETRFNDGKVDPLGNFFAGTMTFDGKKAIGNLYSLQKDGSIKVLEKNLLLSNGMDWSPDATKFYLADTNSQVIYCYDYDSLNGNISDRQNFIEFKDAEYPDGLCIDTQGNLWIAMWSNGKIIQFDNEGNRINEIMLPVTHPTSCCFGGKSLSTLFITTSMIELSEEERQNQPLAGKILKIETTFQGQPNRKYKG
jgi:xylono-1,5-lactonase